MSKKSDNSAEEEPSIEEILASIRQIISDDDEEEVVAAKEEEKPIENPIHDSSDDVLELTEDDLVEDEAEEDDQDEDDSEDLQIELRDRLEEIRRQSEAREAEQEEEPPMVDKKPMPSDILSSGTQAAALNSLSKLTKRMPIERSRSYDGVTLEDIVRELLHPMLREWMDDNLPPMVERTVQKELEKLARRAMDD